MPTVWQTRENSDSGWVNRKSEIIYSGFSGGYNFKIIDVVQPIFFMPRSTSIGSTGYSTVWEQRTNSDTGWVKR